MVFDLAPIATGFLGDVGSGLVGKIFGGGTSLNKQHVAQEQLLNYQKRLQEDYDSHQIQRRVADAKAAGVSPMAALGMQPGSGFVGSTGSFDFQAPNGDTGIGQNLGRAISAAADPMVRLNMRLANAQIEGQELDNDYKRSQLMRQVAHVGPPMPGVASDGANVSSDQRSYHTPDGAATTLPTGELVDLVSDFNPYGMAYMLRDLLGRGGRVLRAFRSYRDSVQDWNARKWAPYRAHLDQRG